MSEQNECPRCSRFCPESAFACGTCANGASENLLSISMFLGWADEKRARLGSNIPVGKSTPSSETPLPYDPRVTKVVRPVELGLKNMIEGVSRESGLHAGKDAEWLARQTGHMTRLHWCPEAFDEIKGWEDNLAHLFDSPPDKIYLGRCNSHTEFGPCSASLYVEVSDVAHATCPTCGTAHNVSERRQELLAGVEDYLGTVKEISRLLRLTLGDDVSERMIRGMVDHGLVSKRGDRTEVDVMGRRREVFLLRIGDVRAAVHVMHADRDMAKDVKRSARAS